MAKKTTVTGADQQLLARLNAHPELKERIAAILEWPERMDLWDTYIDLRRAGKNTLDAEGKPIDVFGRKAHRHYLENREEMDAYAVLANPHNFEAAPQPDGSERRVGIPGGVHGLHRRPPPLVGLDPPRPDHDAQLLETQALDVWSPPGRDYEVVELVRLAAPGDLHA